MKNANLCPAFGNSNGMFSFPIFYIGDDNNSKKMSSFPHYYRGNNSISKRMGWLVLAAPKIAVPPSAPKNSGSRYRVPGFLFHASLMFVVYMLFICLLCIS